MKLKINQKCIFLIKFTNYLILRWLYVKIYLVNKQYFIDILEEVNNLNWQEREKYWIKHIKENGYKLTNMTDGGDGNNNQIFTEE